MTKCGAGMTMWGAGMTNRGAGALGKVGLASDTLEALPHSSPPLWIPAFAGMTKCGAGMTKWGAGDEVGGRHDEVGRRNDEVGGPALLGGRLGLRCPGSLATLLTAPLDSGLRRNDEMGLRCACQAKSWYKSLQVGLYASISLIFQALFHSLSAFSLLIALSMVSCVSYHTRVCTP